jgi:hypothetical protein
LGSCVAIHSSTPLSESPMIKGEISNSRQ